MTTDSFSPLGTDVDDEPPAPPRLHHVTAVLVAHDGARWLPATLTTLARSTRPPDVVQAVDTGSTDDSAALLAASLGPDAVITLGRDSGFGAAVAAGVVAADQRVPTPDDDETDETPTAPSGWTPAAATDEADGLVPPE